MSCSGRTARLRCVAELRGTNDPGVTVELEQADVALGRAGTVEIVDVPGSYSLVARSQEE